MASCAKILRHAVKVDCCKRIACIAGLNRSCCLPTIVCMPMCLQVAVAVVAVAALADGTVGGVAGVAALAGGAAALADGAAALVGGEGVASGAGVVAAVVVAASVAAAVGHKTCRKQAAQCWLAFLESKAPAAVHLSVRLLTRIPPAI